MSVLSCYYICTWGKIRAEKQGNHVDYGIRQYWAGHSVKDPRFAPGNLVKSVKAAEIWGKSRENWQKDTSQEPPRIRPSHKFKQLPTTLFRIFISFPPFLSVEILPSLWGQGIRNSVLRFLLWFHVPSSNPKKSYFFCCHRMKLPISGVKVTKFHNYSRWHWRSTSFQEAIYWVILVVALVQAGRCNSPGVDDLECSTPFTLSWQVDPITTGSR